MNYADAQLNCKNKLGNSWILFEPRDANTSQLVAAAAANLISGFYWLGINDLANQGQYVYASDKQDIVNGMWQPGEPNNVNERCVGGYYNGGSHLGEWSDNPCQYTVYSICQAKNTGKEQIIRISLP